MDADITSLVRKAKQGDSAAFSKLYEYYAEDMHRFALYMLKSSHDAEDAVQEAALSAWKNIKNLREESLFKAWIFKILSNRCKSMLTSAGKNPDSLDFGETEFLLSDTDDGFSFKSCELKEALLKLTPPDGQIVLLSIIGGFKSDELARIYNMPPGTVRSKQKRALEKLRAYLS